MSLVPSNITISSTNVPYPKIELNRIDNDELERFRDYDGIVKFWIDWKDKVCLKCRTCYKLQIVIYGDQVNYCGAWPQCDCDRDRESFSHLMEGFKRFELKGE